MMSFAQKLDPTGHFSGRNVPPKKLVEALGIVPYFVLSAAEDAQEPTARAVLDIMAEAYGFYLGDMEGGTVDAEGVYSYPEDPDLYPLIKWTVGEKVDVFMYPYAIVAVRDGTNTIITRMD